MSYATNLTELPAEALKYLLKQNHNELKDIAILIREDSKEPWVMSYDEAHAILPHILQFRILLLNALKQVKELETVSNN